MGGACWGGDANPRRTLLRSYRQGLNDQSDVVIAYFSPRR